MLFMYIYFLLIQSLLSGISFHKPGFFNRIFYFQHDPSVNKLRAEEESFFYQIQRNYATRAFAVPLPEFKASLQALLSSDEEKKILSDVVFVYASARCGSSLFSRLMDSVAGVQNISECDIFTSIAYLHCQMAETYSLESRLDFIRSSTLLLAYSLRQANPSKPRIVIKHRGFVINIAKLLQQAVPEAKVVFY